MKQTIDIIHTNSKAADALKKAKADITRMENK